MDLGAAGLQSARWNLSYLQFSVPDPEHYTLSFSGNERLLAAIVTPVRQVHGPVPRDVRVIVVDASTGQALGDHSWPAIIASKVALSATEKGEFLLRDREGLHLYSGAFDELKSVPLPDARQKVFEEWKISVTPSRNFVVVTHVLGKKIEVQWLEPGTLNVRRSWMVSKGIPRAEVYPILSASDESIAVSWSRPGECDVSVQDAPDSWHAVFHSQEQCGTGAQYLNHNTLFVPGPGVFRVFGVDGKLLWAKNLAKGERAFYGSVSETGQRLAIPISTSRGGSQLLDIGPHEHLKRIEVYDLGSHRCICKMQGSLQDLSGFALSPDGSLMAILAEGVVELYKLPAA